MSLETVPNAPIRTGTTVTAQFPDLFQLLLQVLVVLNFYFLFVFHSGLKWTGNINNQALPFCLIQYHNVRLVVFNLVVSLYFEVPQQLVVSGLIHWLWLMVVMFFIHHNPTFHIGPSGSPASPCAYIIIIIIIIVVVIILFLILMLIILVRTKDGKQHLSSLLQSQNFEQHLRKKNYSASDMNDLVFEKRTQGKSSCSNS